MFLKGFDYSYLLLVIPILRMNWSVLQYRTQASIVVPFILLWFMCLFLKERRKLIPSVVLNRYFFLTLFSVSLYIILPLIYGIHDPGNRLAFRPIGALARFVEFLVMISIVHMTLIMGKLRELKFCTLILAFTFLWNGIAAMRGGAQVAQMGGGARVITALSQQGHKSAEYYQDVHEVLTLGMGNAESAYISAFAFPLFLYSMFKIRGWVRRLVLVLLAICSYLNIKYSGLNTPIMIAVVGCSLLLLSGLKKRFLILLTGILLALYMVVFSFNPRIMSFMSGPFYAIADATEELPQIHQRCKSMAEAVAGTKDTYAAQRYELQQVSALEFVRGNILFGKFFDRRHGRGGGHSEFLDCLAAYGLLGGGIIALFWFAYLKYSNQLSIVSLGSQWLFMPYIYAGTWFFSSIVNPSVLGHQSIVLLIPGLAVFYSDFERKWGLK